MNVLKPHQRSHRCHAAARTTFRSTRSTARPASIARRSASTRWRGSRRAGRRQIPPVATGSPALADQIPPPRPPALAGRAAVDPAGARPSACEPHRAWIEAQVGLGRNAMAIYQDLVERHGFQQPLQHRQALLRGLAPARAGAVRRAGVSARRGGAGRLRPGRADAGIR